MSKERFEIFGKIIKDNEEVPNLLDNYLATVRLNELNDKVKVLEQELAEKQNTIDEINKEFVQAVHDWKTLCAEKDKEIAHLKEMDNYHLLYELAGADETIANLKKQLEEKDKEIEKIKTKQKPIVMHSKENYYFLEEENIKLHFAQKQLAIQELEKVKNFVDGRTYCADYINKRIQELKGE